MRPWTSKSCTLFIVKTSVVFQFLNFFAQIIRRKVDNLKRSFPNTNNWYYFNFLVSEHHYPDVTQKQWRNRCRSGEFTVNSLLFCWLSRHIEFLSSITAFVVSILVSIALSSMNLLDEVGWNSTIKQMTKVTD